VNITQDVEKDSQENLDENGSIGSNDSIEGNLELIPVEENNKTIHESPQHPNPELIPDNKNEEAAQKNPRYNLRPRRERNYDHLFAQMNYRAGLKAFRNEAIKAIKKEMKQLHQYNCVTPRSDLFWKQKRGALE